MNQAALTQSIIAAVASITGHDPADLEETMSLEAELGLDSIKMVTLLQALQELIPVDEQDRFRDAVPAETLLQAQTIGDLVSALSGWQVDSAPSAVQPPPAAPVSRDEPSIASTAAEVPVLHSQYPFLVGHYAISTCSLCSRVRLRGAFVPGTARLAWNDLLARHPALRGRFVVPAGATSFAQYRFEIEANHQAPEVKVIDLAALDPQAQELAIAREVERCVNAEWDLDCWPLHSFLAYRLNADTVDLFYTNHHLVCDGISNQQVLREFIELYRARAEGTPALLPALTTVERYRETAAAINAWSSAEEDHALNDFLRAQGKQPFYWSPRGVPRPAARAKVRNYRFELEGEATRALIELTRAWRLPMNTLISGAFLRALSHLAASDGPIILNIPTSGRVYPGVDAGGIVGCFAQNLALTFAPCSAGGDWRAQLEGVHREIEKAIARGYDRAQTRQAAMAARDRLRLREGRIQEVDIGFIRAGMKSNLYLPYIGQTRIARSNGSLEVIDYQAATVTNAGTLDTVAEQFDGRLVFTTNYDAAVHDESFVATLAGEFVARLRELAGQVPSLPAALESVARTAGADAHRLEVIRVAEEVMHCRVSDVSFGQDLEADLGLDSLERIRIVLKLEGAIGGVDRPALLACRTLAEMCAALAGKGSASPPPARAASTATSAATSATAPDDDDERHMPYVQIVEQCSRTPDAIAILSSEGGMTYAELDSLSNRLANLLRAGGVGRGTLVGIMLERGPRMLVGMLAILKAGGAYVPLDPDYPAARLGYMLAHARLETVLIEDRTLAKLRECVASGQALRTLVAMDECTAPAPTGLALLAVGKWLAADQSVPVRASSPDDLMVVLYTSGSTGTPKGVALAHRGYANRFEWHQDTFRLRAGERVAQKTSVCFDISLWEMFWPLMLGGCVCPVGRDVVCDPWQLAHWMREMRINVMHFVPSLFGEFLNALGKEAAAFPGLRSLVFSGEALPVSFVRRWFERFGRRVALANLYGPTEASIDVTAHLMTAAPAADTERIPIGRPMPNVHVAILDERMQPVKKGEVGELWLGGIQLAQGYLFDLERTAQSFKPNPFAHIPGKHLYRTGDLAAELSDGSIDYRGRIDSQIKIRGFRVELGEIEATVGAYPEVDEVAVLALDYEEGQKRLVAYLAGRELEPRELRERLAKELPEYMVPHRFEWLPALPKNQNGKLDRGALRDRPAPALVPADAAVRQAAAEPPAQADGLPPGPAQRWLLAYFSPPYQWAGFTRFRYLQPLDLELFDRALNLAAQRHPALCTVFRNVNGQWRQHFMEPEQPFSAERMDGTHLAEAEREAQVRRRLMDTVPHLRIDQGPLWRVLVVKEGEARYDITVIGHHIVSDLISNGILFKDVWRIYGQLLSGGGAEGVDAPPSFADYLCALSDAGTAAGLERAADYWIARFPSREYAFHVPLDHHQGANIESSAARERFELGGALPAALQRVRQAQGCSLYALLLAPLYQALGEWSGQQRVVLSHRVHGRDLGDGRTFFESVGDFAVNYPLALSLEGGTGPSDARWAGLISRVGQALSEVPMNGISFDLLADRLPGWMYPDTNLTPVRVNYLGSRTLPKSSVFEFAAVDWDQRLALPEQQRISLIEVFLSVADSQINVEIEYSANFHRAATIRALGKRYVELITDLAGQPAAASAGGAVAALSAEPSIKADGESHLDKSSDASVIPLASRRHTPAALPLAGKVAIVTGAGRGIGRAIGRTLTEKGAKVALVSRSTQQLEETLAEVSQVAREGPAEVMALTADVSDLAQVQEMAQTVAGRWGGIDILVNNAGVNGSSLLAESDPRHWRNIIEVNLFGVYYCARSVLPYLLERGGGKIVNIGSAASVIGYPLFSAYSASKHAVLGLTRALAEEVKQRNIQVNAICPAFVDTRMTPQAFRGNSIPTGHIADVVLFLCSAQSNSITGEAINIFGRQDMYSYGSERLAVIQSMTRDFRPGLQS